MSVAYNHKIRNNAVDEYITPLGLVKAAVKLLFCPAGFCAYSAPKVLDPGANSGRWGTVVKDTLPNAHLSGVELMDMPKPDSFDSWHVADFLTWDTDQRFDLIIGNPPYSCRLSGKRVTVADTFVEKSLNLLAPNGVLLFLLRRNFACGVTRNTTGVLSHSPFNYEYRCARRPSFSKEDDRYLSKSANTNTHDYSVFMWLNSLWTKDSISRPLFWEY